MKQGCAFIAADLRCYSDTPVLQESVARSRLLGRFYAKSREKFESCILKMKFYSPNRHCKPVGDVIFLGKRCDGFLIRSSVKFRDR